MIHAFSGSVATIAGSFSESSSKEYPRHVEVQAVSTAVDRWYSVVKKALTEITRRPGAGRRT